MTTIQVLVTAEIERESGKFASREEMVDALIGEIDSANPGSLNGIGADGESTYEITDWAVEEYTTPKQPKRPKGTVILIGSVRQAYRILFPLEGHKVTITTKYGAVVYGTLMRVGRKVGVTLSPVNEPGEREVPFNELVRVELDS